MTQEERTLINQWNEAMFMTEDAVEEEWYSAEEEYAAEEEEEFC